MSGEPGYPQAILDELILQSLQRLLLIQQKMADRGLTVPELDADVREMLAVWAGEPDDGEQDRLI